MTFIPANTATLSRESEATRDTLREVVLEIKRVARGIELLLGEEVSAEDVKH